MRQVGVIAAPGIIALNEGASRLPEDHAKARLLADLLLEIPGIVVEEEKVQTNMVFLRIVKGQKTESELVEYLDEHGFTLNPPFFGTIRLVMSYEVNEEDVRALAAAIADYMGK